MNRADRILARLPQSTDSFSCPWWESFAACCVASIVLGLTSRELVGIIPALAAAALLWRHTAHRVRAFCSREGDGPAC